MFFLYMINLSQLNFLQGAVYGTAFSVNYLANTDVYVADTFAKAVLASSTTLNNVSTNYDVNNNNAYNTIFNYLTTNNPFSANIYIYKMYLF